MMAQDEVEAIASAVIDKIEQHRQAFWIEPERHYNDHMELSKLLEAWAESKSMFFKAFLGFIIVGSLIIALVGMSFGKIFK